jgi:penicillin-binding protein 1A
MANKTGSGKNSNTQKNNKKPRKRARRFILSLLVVFLIMGLSAAAVTYKIVSGYLADVPDFDPEVLVPSATSFVFDKNGTEVTPLMGDINRVVIPLDQIPQHMINAVIAIEDDRFYDHNGFDLRGIMRAAWKQFRNQSFGAQGGSTITQQLVKLAFLTPEKQIKRKVQELYLAIKMERSYTKDEILEFYLNRIEYDYNSAGVEVAAQTFFNKSITEVTLAEAAMLAGVPNLPALYSPFRNLTESVKRRNVILNRMEELGMISAAEAAEAKNEEPVLADLPSRAYPFPHFIDHIIHDEMIRILKEIPRYKDTSVAERYDILYKGGLKIYTTLDQRIQQVAEDTLNNEKLYPKTFAEDGKPLQPQAAVIVADHKTGHIKAMVGGREYGRENVLNRAVKGKAQAGSVLKPIVAYAPAFNEGIALPSTVIDDSPWVWSIRGSEPWYPNNYDRTFVGLVTARVALARSLNVPAARLILELGVEKSKEYAEKMGITTLEKDRGPSLVLGGLTEGLKVIDAAQAFSVLANQGVRTDFVTVLKIEDSSGKTIYEHAPKSSVVLSKEAAFLTSSVLQDAVRMGTVSGLKIGRPVAAKTGTSDKNRDAWLAAYTPDLVGVFWIGRDSYAVDEEGDYRAWIVTPPFMNPILMAAHEGLPVRDFARPESISPPIPVCNKSGKRPGPFCPPEDIVHDYFPHDQIPFETCDIHIEVEICQESGLLATEFCPHDTIIKKVFLNRPAYLTTDDNWVGPVGRIPKDAGLMPPTEYCNIHTERPADLPEQPFGLIGEYRLAGYVQLNWQSAYGWIDGYLVYRRAPWQDDYHLLTEFPVTALSYIDDAVHEEGTYRYRVYSVDIYGVRSKPASVSVTVGTEPSQPPPDSQPGNSNRGRGNNSGNNN